MMDTRLSDLLPEALSDEGAYHLVNFMFELALAAESQYLAQLMRYSKEENRQPPDYLE
jgi:hypothetical protein